VYIFCGNSSLLRFRLLLRTYLVQGRPPLPRSMTTRHLDVCRVCCPNIGWLPAQFGLPLVAVPSGNELIAEPPKDFQLPRVGPNCNHYCGPRMGEVRVNMIGNHGFLRCEQIKHQKSSWIDYSRPGKKSAEPASTSISLGVWG
jgi:hypothetical protein